jgi:hypothetical protein
VALLAPWAWAAGDLGLPPATANRILDGKADLARLTFREAFLLLAEKRFLDVNLVIAPGTPGLERPCGLRVAGLTLGEVVQLLLQLTDTKLAPAGRRTFVVTRRDDPRQFGARRTATLYPLRVLPSRVLEFLEADPELRVRVPPGVVHADDRFGLLQLTATPSAIEALRALVRRLDQGDDSIWARIPVSFVDGDDLATALEALPEHRRAILPGWVYQERGRMVVARGTAEQVARLQEAVRAVDLPPGQAQVRLDLYEVSEAALRRLGLTLTGSSLEVASLDRLLRPTGSIGARLEYALEKLGARSRGSRWLTVLDGETATAQLGEVRNVRTSSLAAGPGTVAITSGVREVPLGLTVTLTPQVHHDGTATLALDVLEERPLAIREFGVDRTSQGVSTKVRAQVGVPILVSGFDQAARSRTRQGSTAAERRSDSSRQVLVLTLFPDPAAPKGKPENRTRSGSKKNFSRY